MNNALMTILSLSVSGSILTLILFAGKPLLKNRVSRTFSYYIWLLVLLRLVMPIATPVNVMSSLFGMEQPSVNSTVVEQTGISAGTGTKLTGKQEAVPSNTYAVSSEPKNGNVTEQTGEQIAVPSKIQTVSSEPQSGKSAGIQWFQIWNLIKNNLLWIWLAGSAVSLGWFMIAYACFSRSIRRSCVMPHGDDLAVFERMCGKKRVRMACSSRATTPMLIGVLRPVIVFPQFAYVQNGMDKELINILRHELTHYRRKDVLYKWLVVAVTALHWFNPFMLLIRGEIGRACELSCDEAVISGMSEDEKRFYGNTLLAFSANKKLPSIVLSTTLCEDKKELKERLISIMKYKKKSMWVIVLTLMLTVLLAGCAAVLGTANSSGGVAMPEGSAAVSKASPAFMPGDAISVSGENNAFSLYSLDFLDENSGWVIRDKYNTAYTETKSQLLRTQDGGTHWTEVGSDSYTLYAVKFIDTDEGWSISQVSNKAELNPGSDDAKIQYTVMHTSDGGATWSVQWKGEQTSTSNLSLWFQNASNGFALVGNTLLTTQNGGGAWTSVSFGTNDFTPQSVSFTDRKTGWVMGVNGKDDEIIVLHTKDGGNNWNQQFEKTYSDSAGSMGSIGIDFTDSNTGWFLTSDLGTWNGELYGTTDGGSNWQVINQIKCNRPTPTSIHFISSSVGWIPLDVGAGPITGGLMYTCDGGKSFQVVGANPNSDYSDAAQKITSARDVDFVSGQQGWAIGLNTNHGDYLLRTKDGGATWTQVYPALLPTQDISFADGKTGFGLGALSDFGALLGSSDGGSSWQVVKSFAQDY